MVESSGNLQTVLGLEIEYRESRKATLTVWHPLMGSDALRKFLAAEAAVFRGMSGTKILSLHITEQTKKFREDDGTKVFDKSMQLQLKHLVSAGVGIPSKALHEEVVVMTYSQLAEYLDEGRIGRTRRKDGQVNCR